MLDDVVANLDRCRFRGAIVGAHGVGKSSLLEHLVPRVGSIVYRRDAEGNETRPHEVVGRPKRAITWLQLRRSAPRTMQLPWSALKPTDLLILDGYEQLRGWRRAWVVWRTRACRLGLLVTSHRHTLLPTICQLHLDAKLAQQIIQQLLASHARVNHSRAADSERLISLEEITQQLSISHGNIRELLMDCYDRFEQQR